MSLKLDLDPAFLKQFIGGQLEVQKGKASFGLNRDLRRGEIGQIEKDDTGTLHIRFAWLGKSIGGVPPTQGWAACDELDYAIPLEGKTVMRSPHPEGYDRIVIASPDMSETAALFPPGTSSFSQAVFVKKPN